MLRIIIIAVFLHVLGTTSGKQVKYKDCGSKLGKDITVTVDPCMAEPCTLTLGTSYTIGIDFTTNQTHSAVEAEGCPTTRHSLRWDPSWCDVILISHVVESSWWWLLEPLVESNLGLIKPISQTIDWSSSRAASTHCILNDCAPLWQPYWEPLIYSLYKIADLVTSLPRIFLCQCYCCQHRGRRRICSLASSILYPWDALAQKLSGDNVRY